MDKAEELGKKLAELGKEFKKIIEDEPFTKSEYENFWEVVREQLSDDDLFYLDVATSSI